MIKLRAIKWREYWLYRWYKGGLWIQHDDRGWVRGQWSPRLTPSGRLEKGCIYDENSCGYHRTLRGILKIEDYT